MNLSSPLELLHNYVQAALVDVTQQLNTKSGRIAIWLSDKEGVVPRRVQDFITAAQMLNHMVRELQEKGTEPLAATVTLLKDSEEVVGQLGRKFHCSQFLECLMAGRESRTLDPHHLLTPNSFKEDRRINPSHFEWTLNLGLLMRVYQRVEDPVLKKEIGFLALNYLAKAAPYCFDELPLPPAMQRHFNQEFHHGLIEPGMAYNRETPIFDALLSEDLSNQLASGSGNSLFIIGKGSIEELFPTWFSMIRTEKTEEADLGLQWSQEIVRLVEADMEQAVSNNFEKYLEPALFLDLTCLLEKFLYTAGEEQKDRRFQECLDNIRKHADKAVMLAAQKLIGKHPHRFQTEEETQRLIVFLRSNITFICRGQLKGVGFVKIIPLFDQLDFFTLPRMNILSKLVRAKQGPKLFAQSLIETNVMRAKAKLNDFISGTGIRMSSIEGREALLDFMSLEKVIQLNQGSLATYSIPGPNVAYYDDPIAMTQTHLFRKFADDVENVNMVSRFPYLHVLGKTTVKLIRGLVSDIDRDKWKALNTHPDSRQILQNSIVRMLQHLANAENHLTDFGKFTQAIELVHCEMATLLRMFAPYSREDFSPLYLSQNQVIPEELQAYAQAGLTKTSMNTLAGINVALRKMYDHPKRVCQQAAHFEIVQGMGREASLEEALKDDALPVHLYVCDINHNINFSPLHHHYQASDVKSEIESLLLAKPKTEHLTIALDCTIDFENSQRVRELLKHFSPEIKKGKLNFVIFRSGQKFDMLGMDDRYGSPFYMINNRDACWKPFDELFTQDLYKTDLLSTQWFCLINKFAPEATDVYRKLIFENTRHILDSIPESLKPGQRPDIKVCTVEKEMEACFIDIKIMGESAGKMSNRIFEALYQKFAEHNGKIHTRGGYGFYHPNISFFPLADNTMQGSCIRINPGIDREECNLIIEALKDLAFSLEEKVHSGLIISTLLDRV